MLSDLSFEICIHNHSKIATYYIDEHEPISGLIIDLLR